MYIKDVKAIRADRYCYAKITTDNGITGVGESGAFGCLDASAAQISCFGEMLVGKDPLNIEQLWQAMFRGSYFRGAAVMGAISAIDVALWDIAGKYYNSPIWKLLGGKARNKIRVYSHVFGKTDKEMAESLEKRASQGYTAVGHVSPFLDEPSEKIFDKTHVQIMNESIKRAHKIREIIGDDIDICFEFHRRCKPGEAVVIINEIEDTHPLFVEDPIPPGDTSSMAYVLEHINVPLATGERLHTIYEFEDLITRRATNYVRVSLTTAGGITGAKKIAAMAEPNMMQIIPHNPLSPVCTAAEMQLCTFIDNVLICEYPDADGPLLGARGHKRSELVTNAPMPVDGYVPVCEEPGLGLSLVDDVEIKFPAVSMKRNYRLNSDGSLRDQ